MCQPSQTNYKWKALIVNIKNCLASCILYVIPSQHQLVKYHFIYFFNFAKACSTDVLCPVFSYLDCMLIAAQWLYFSYPFNTEKLWWTLPFIVLDWTKAVCRDERGNHMYWRVWYIYNIHFNLLQLISWFYIITLFNCLWQRNNQLFNLPSLYVSYVNSLVLHLNSLYINLLNKVYTLV